MVTFTSHRCFATSSSLATTVPEMRVNRKTQVYNHQTISTRQPLRGRVGGIAITRVIESLLLFSLLSLTCFLIKLFMSMTLLNCDNVLRVILKRPPPLLLLRPSIKLNLHTLMMNRHIIPTTQASTTSFSPSTINDKQYQEEKKRVKATGSSRYGKVTIARRLKQ